MSSDYDASEFIDGDFQAQKASYAASAGAASQLPRAPSREEVDAKVADTQQKLAELKRAQEELERERAGLEETRRRQAEFHTGRQEMIQHLTRGVGLLQEAEFKARRDAEQMAKALEGLREGLNRLESIHEETWSKNNFDVELTRALTAVENARMEWNGARLKFPLLSADEADASAHAQEEVPPILAGLGFKELCRLGFALTWPLTAVALLILAVALVLLLR